MRILVEKDDGTIIEVKEIESVPNDVDTLIFFSDYIISCTDTLACEKSLSEKIGKKCVVVSGCLTKVIGV